MKPKLQLAKRTEITIETRSVMRINTIAADELFCGECGEVVVPILGWQVVRATGINKKHIESLRLRGEIHKINGVGICSASLSRYLNKENR